jgi:serine/threonine-protein kinase
MGVIVFEMLTGRPPYEADTPAKLMFKHVHESVPNILVVRPELPPMCQDVIARAMAKSPASRFGTAVELAQSLHRALPANERMVQAEAAQEVGEKAALAGADAAAVSTSAETMLPADTNLLDEVSQNETKVNPPFFSVEAFSELLRGNNRTLGIAIIILIILLCGGMLLVPSIWSMILNF